MSWASSVGLIPVAQQEKNYCAPACVQMILSSMGMTELSVDMQSRLMTFIDNEMKSTVQIGSSIGLAHTINAFNTSGFKGPNFTPSSTEYRPAQTATPYEACALVVDGLLRYRLASAVMVLSGGHWVVVFGADGEGNPAVNGGAFAVKRLLVCNPDNGRFGGYPGAGNAPKPTTPGFIIEETLYPAFITTYFNGALTETPLPSGYIGTDGRFFIVATSRAQPSPGMMLPDPRYPPGPYQPLGVTAEGLMKQCDSDASLIGAQKGAPRTVFRFDRKHNYYLVPVVLPDGSGQVFRFDQQGRYLARAFGTAEDARFLFDDDAAIRSVQDFGKENGLALDAASLRRQDTLFWLPSVESASPYYPFDVVTDGDGKRFFVSQRGEVSTTLHDRLTEQAFLIQ